MELDREYVLKKNGKIVAQQEPIVFYAKKDEKEYQIIYIPSNSSQYKKNNFAKIANSSKEIIVIKDTNKKIKYDDKEISEYPSNFFLRNHEKAWREKGQHCKILTNDEVNNYTNIHKMLVESFPKLSPNSVEAVWYGLEEGNVVEITSGSISSAGIACSLKRVASTKKVDVEGVFEDE